MDKSNAPYQRLPTTGNSPKEERDHPPDQPTTLRNDSATQISRYRIKDQVTNMGRVLQTLRLGDFPDDED